MWKNVNNKNNSKCPCQSLNIEKKDHMILDAKAFTSIEVKVSIITAMKIKLDLQIFFDVEQYQIIVHKY